MNAIESEFDMIFKIIILGDSGVGKTNILSRYLKDQFSDDSKPTVGVEFASKEYNVGSYKIKAQMWDTAGQERFRAVTNAYYKGSKGAFVVYDISRKNTFESVDKLISDIKLKGDENVVVILIGNKCDLEAFREVTSAEGQEKAKCHNVAFMETSALSAVNIAEAFDLMIQEIFRIIHTQLEEQYDQAVNEKQTGADIDVNSNTLLPNSSGVNINLNTATKPSEKKKCC